MSNVAFSLQGRNGVAQVTTGQSFSGRSTGLMVAVAANMAFDVVAPNGASDITVTIASAPVGFSPGGTITAVTVTSGTVLVYPEGAYTVV